MTTTEAATTAQSEIWLPQILEIIRREGFQAFSLGIVADRLGTSGRMLVYHYGSKDQLLGRVIRASRDERIADFSRNPPAALEEAVGIWWAYFSTNLAEMQMFFYLVTRRFERPDDFEAFAANALDGWVAFFADSVRAESPDAPDADALGHLTVATLRGLLADYMITGDLERIEETLRLFLARLRTEPTG
ncbi:MAG: TetR/AcrR family transcriptional regulator [Pseudoclavibacter sp.]